jgi:hypothetical protein
LILYFFYQKIRRVITIFGGLVTTVRLRQAIKSDQIFMAFKHWWARAVNSALCFRAYIFFYQEHNGPIAIGTFHFNGGLIS